MLCFYLFNTDLLSYDKSVSSNSGSKISSNQRIVTKSAIGETSGDKEIGSNI